MATFDAPFHEQAFIEMEEGKKTVYVILATEEYDCMSAGDRLEFGSHGSIHVGMVRRYPDLESLMEAEGFHNLVPQAETAEAALGVIRSIEEWDAEAEKGQGVLALRVREARRK
ncbi:MAG: hypothetical protein JXB39_07145 [Deltaproteobacteria bacterium]|nr:hypothetical protein [Deltaproteobacteria bacterium]